MTLTAEGPTRRRGLSLRALVVLLVLAGGLYAAAVALYFTISTGAAANALGQGTTAVVALQDDLGKRHGALIRARRLTWQLLRRSTPPRVAELDRVRALAAAGAVRARAEPYASVPPELRVVLARVDESLSRLGNTLTEACAALELGRRSQAVRTMERADSLQNRVDEGLERATQLARADLLVRQAALRQVTRHAVRDGGLMLAAVVLFVPLALLVVRRRLWQPLVGLEEGLRRVGEGDLTTQVPVRRQDELGRVSALFNDTTLILRNRAEEQGRFAAAGELLAGVAHEVNNPLMAIASHAELRLGDPDLSAEQRAEMQSILRQAQRAAKLLRGLLRFVRAGEPRAARVNLNDAVRGAIDLVAYRFPVDEISIEGQLDHTLPPVEGDANRLEQVLVNLLSNALDALRNVPPPRRLIVDSYVEDGRVCVAVTDNGPGVAPEIAQRLFRPFATTKGRRGTGLGLYISRQLVREAGGDLALVRAPGRGARFLVTLPPAGTVVPDSTPAPAPAPAGAPVAAPAALAAPPGPGEPAAPLANVRVLLVDDEELIRSPMRRFLARRGASVSEARDGLEALDLLRAGLEPQVMLVDLRMPRMDGVELYARLQAEYGRLAERVLFLSGDITQLAGRALAEVPRDRVLVKPLELVELEQKIREFVNAAT